MAPDRTSDSSFDEAWAQWRQAVTAVLTPPSGDVSPAVHQALVAVGAFDPVDGLIRRAWALGLFTGEASRIEPLRAEGLSQTDVAQLIALLQHHPLPAAGG
jgi:hypothetical protein